MDNGERIPARFCAGRPDANGGAVFSDNLNPHLAWSDVPAGTRSFALICHDFDVPSRGDDVNQTDREVPAELLRVDFFHWVLADLPATLHEIAEGAFSRGFTPRGKPGPAVEVAGCTGARHGLNDYTGWFAGNAEMAGDYFGYDGPFPPFNDSLVAPLRLHALCAGDAARRRRRPVHRRAGAPGDLSACARRRNAFGTYTLNRRLIG